MADRAKAVRITPVLVVSNIEQAVEYYSRLGFVEPAMWGQPPCFAMLNRDGLDLMLASPEEGEEIGPRGFQGPWSMSILVEDIEAEIAALRNEGVPIAAGPRDMFYGMREIDCVDPDGNRICLAQDISAAGV